MNSETWDACLEIQRAKHDLAHKVLGMLLCDAFSGHFSHSAGEHLRREQAMREMNAPSPPYNGASDDESVETDGSDGLPELDWGDVELSDGDEVAE